MHFLIYQIAASSAMNGTWLSQNLCDCFVPHHTSLAIQSGNSGSPKHLGVYQV